MKRKDLSQSLHRQRPLLERRLVLAFRDLPQGRAETGAVEQKSDRKVVLKRTGAQGARGPFGVGLELPNHSGPTRQAQQGAIDEIIESILPQSKRFQRVDDRLDRTAIRCTVLCDQIRKLLEPTWLENRAYPVELLKQFEQGSIPIRQSPLRKALVGRATQKTNQLLVDTHIAIDAVRAQHDIPMATDRDRVFENIVENFTDERCALDADSVQPCQCPGCPLLWRGSRRRILAFGPQCELLCDFRISLHPFLYGTQDPRFNVRGYILAELPKGFGLGDEPPEFLLRSISNRVDQHGQSKLIPRRAKHDRFLGALAQVLG
jgi:hypothetical protein